MARRMFAVTNYIGNIDRFSPSSSFLSFFLTLCFVHQIINIIVSFRFHATTFITTVHKKASFQYRERILCRLGIVKTNTYLCYPYIYIKYWIIKTYKANVYQNWKLFGLLSPIDPNRYSAHFSVTQSIHFLLVTIFNFYKILMSKIFFLLCNV